LRAPIRLLSSQRAKRKGEALYRYLEDIATADIAFEAEGPTLEQALIAASEAAMNVMVEDLATIAPREQRTIEIEDQAPDMLLLDLLQELIYYKDAEQLLLRIEKLAVAEEGGVYRLRASAAGEKLDPARHEQRADVKAVTLHRLSLERTGHGWKALVILDI
jgi:SHS2 domain-containing protein